MPGVKPSMIVPILFCIICTRQLLPIFNEKICF